ncbi:MAG: RDD family protein, partial [Oscillospiraceae bacterium]
LNPSSIPDSLITVFLIILFAYILLESLLLMTKKGDLGMIIFKLNLEDKQGNKPRFFKVFLRTTIKYFSIALFPILFMFPLLSMGFYHKKIFLHELASGVYKVPKKNETNINKQVDPEEKLRINNAKKALIVNIIAGCIFSVAWSILLLILKKYDLSDTAIIVYLRIPILIIETLILNLTQKISGKYFWLISLFQIVLFTFVLQKICAAIMW